MPVATAVVRRSTRSPGERGDQVGHLGGTGQRGGVAAGPLLPVGRALGHGPLQVGVHGPVVGAHHVGGRPCIARRWWRAPRGTPTGGRAAAGRPRPPRRRRARRRRTGRRRAPGRRSPAGRRRRTAALRRGRWAGCPGRAVRGPPTRPRPARTRPGRAGADLRVLARGGHHRAAVRMPDEHRGLAEAVQRPRRWRRRRPRGWSSAARRPRSARPPPRAGRARRPTPTRRATARGRAPPPLPPPAHPPTFRDHVRGKSRCSVERWLR